MTNHPTTGTLALPRPSSDANDETSEQSLWLPIMRMPPEQSSEPHSGSTEHIGSQSSSPATPTSSIESPLESPRRTSTYTYPQCRVQLSSRAVVQQHVADQHPSFFYHSSIEPEESREQKPRAQEQQGSRMHKCPVQGCPYSQFGFRFQSHLTEHIDKKHAD